MRRQRSRPATAVGAMPAVGGSRPRPAAGPGDHPAPSDGQAIGPGQLIQPQPIRPQPRPAETPPRRPRYGWRLIRSPAIRPSPVRTSIPRNCRPCPRASAHGLLQPVVVRRVKDRYELVAGERRLQAAKRAGWTDVPVNVIEADDRRTAELAIVENLHRKDLNPLEKAASFQRYLQQYACTQEELAGRLKLDRSTIANLIRLLRQSSNF